MFFYNMICWLWNSTLCLLIFNFSSMFFLHIAFTSRSVLLFCHVTPEIVQLYHSGLCSSSLWTFVLPLFNSLSWHFVNQKSPLLDPFNRLLTVGSIGWFCHYQLPFISEFLCGNFGENISSVRKGRILWQYDGIGANYFTFLT